MLEKFLQVDLLGNLYFEEIFLYYEEPLLFSCKNLFGHVFLVNCIDLDEENKVWLALPVSTFKLEQIKRNNISLYDAFTKPEDKFLWSISQSLNCEMGTATRINPDDLSENDLPRKKAYIELENSEDKLITTKQSVDERLILAKNENRVVFDLSLEINEGHSSEITPDALAKTVVEIQDILFAIAHKKGSINSKIPPSIIEDNQLNIVSTYAASFGIRFMSKQLCDIFGELNVSRNIGILIELLAITDNTARARELLENLNPKVGLHYRRLLINLINNNTSIKLYHTTPKKTVSSISMSLEDIKTSLSTLESEIENISNKINSTGVLVGVNVKSKTFVFQPTNEKMITGKISEKVKAEKFIVPLNATISLEENVKINKITGKEEFTYMLSGILE